MIGTRVDSYELLKILGQGAMGIVYRARHTTTGREVALKLLHPGKALAPRALERFQREARAMGTVADSPHAVSVLDAGVDPTSGAPFIVMELLQGEDVEALLGRLGPLSPALALRIVAQALSGLIPAHEKAIVHRDLKPSNLFLMKRAEGEPIVKVLDFGIVKMRADESVPDSSNIAKLTATQQTLGSPAYMSPEQVRASKHIDARSDLWSLGVVLYQLVSGVLPFEAESLADMLMAILNGNAVPVAQRAPWVPPSVAQIIDGAMQRDVAVRFASARQMRDAIVKLLGGGAGTSSAAAAISEAMVAPLSAAERSSRPSLSGMAMGVQGSAAGLGGATAPLTALPGSAAPAMAVSNVGSLAGGTQPLSALPASAAAGFGSTAGGATAMGGATAGAAALGGAVVPGVAAAAPFAFPTQPSAGVVRGGGGKRIGFAVGGLVAAGALGALMFAVISRSTTPAPIGSAADTAQTATPAPAMDAGAALPPVAPDPKAGDAADAGAGPAAVAGDTARPHPGTAPLSGGGKLPPAVSPGTSKNTPDPFKGSRTGK